MTLDRRTFVLSSLAAGVAAAAHRGHLGDRGADDDDDRRPALGAAIA